MILNCRNVNYSNSVNIAVFPLPITKLQGPILSSWTPETSVIDLLMRNMERIGDAQRWLEKVVNWLGSLVPGSEYH